MPYYRVTASNCCHYVVYLLQAETPEAALALLEPALYDCEVADRAEVGDYSECDPPPVPDRDSDEWVYVVDRRDVRLMPDDESDPEEGLLAASLSSAGPYLLDSGPNGGLPRR